MKLRIASLAFLLGCLSTGAAWLTVQPALVRMMEAVNRLSAPGSLERQLVVRVKVLLPFYLALPLLAVSFMAFVVLYLMVGRPVRRTEDAVAQLERLELDLPFEPGGGPLMSGVQRLLTRMAESLKREQATTRRQLSELAAANQRLSRAQMERVSTERLATVGRLAAGVAHEVGNPLSGILGYLSLVRSRASEPQVRDYLDRIEAEVQRVDQIVRGLVDLGRPQRGGAGPVDVEQIVRTCAQLVSKGPDFSEVAMELDLSPGLVARGESGPLSQILINLFINAAQAMGGKGRISVRGRSEKQQMVLEVQDSGPGIPADALPHLFEPFFTTKPAGKGTGLGLAISLHLISAMGGQLRVESPQGGGARFTVLLPAG